MISLIHESETSCLTVSASALLIREKTVSGPIQAVPELFSLSLEEHIYSNIYNEYESLKSVYNTCEGE